MCNCDERDSVQESAASIIEAARGCSYVRASRPDWIDGIRHAARTAGSECDRADRPTVAMRVLLWAVAAFYCGFFWAMMYVLVKDVP